MRSRAARRRWPETAPAHSCRATIAAKTGFHHCQHRLSHSCYLSIFLHLFAVLSRPYFCRHNLFNHVQVGQKSRDSGRETDRYGNPRRGCRGEIFCGSVQRQTDVSSLAEPGACPSFLLVATEAVQKGAETVQKTEKRVVAPQRTHNGEPERTPVFDKAATTCRT